MDVRPHTTFLHTMQFALRWYRTASREANLQAGNVVRCYTTVVQKRRDRLGFYMFVVTRRRCNLSAMKCE